MVCPDSSAGADPKLLLDQLKTIQQRNSVPAVALVLVDEGRVVALEAWGATGNVHFPTADADTPFRVGSISKTFTALTAMAILDTEALALDLPMAPLVGDQFENPWADTDRLRLVHLLELTAGFADLSRKEWDNAVPLTLTQAMALAPASRRVLWPPGTRHSYSNVAPGLTALAIERVTGRSFESVAHDYVLAPLGMSHATFLRDEYVAARLPHGYRADGSTEIPYWHMTFRAFGGLNASAREMSRLLLALLNDGRIDSRQAISTSTMARIFNTASTRGAAAGLGIGYGLGIYGSVRDGFVFHGHGGDGDGFLSRYGLLRPNRRGYYVVINADNPPALARMRRAIEAHLTQDLSDPPPPPIAALSRAELTRLTGTYCPSSTRFRPAEWRSGRLPKAIVEVADGGLRFERAGRIQVLLPVTSQLFRRTGDPLATVAFVDADGGLQLQGEIGNFTRLDAPKCEAFIEPGDSQ